MLQKTLQRKGIEESLDTLLAYTGKTSESIFKDLIKKHNINQTLEEFKEDHRKGGSFYADSPDLEPMPGIVEFLEKMKDLGIPMGIVSSTRSKSVVIALNRINLLKYFDIVVCGDMVENHKPSPDGYLLALKFLQGKPEESLVIEDTRIGIQAGKSAGMKVIGFKGSVFRQDSSNADIEVESYRELMDQMEF